MLFLHNYFLSLIWPAGILKPGLIFIYSNILKEDKEYRFKGKSLVFELAVFIVFALPVLIFVVSLYQKPIFLLPAIIAPGFILYFEYYTILLVMQYKKYDSEKKITITADRQTLNVEHDERVAIFKHDEIERVDIYEGGNLGKFGNFGYLVIYTVNGNWLLITNQTIPLLASDPILSRFLSKKPRQNFKKYFNFIDESKFPLNANT